MRTIDWQDGHIVAIDQTALPHVVQLMDIHTVEDLVAAIKRLAIRGAPALGVAGALGAALAARGEPESLPGSVDSLRQARPTAVNLAWGIDRALGRLADGPQAVLAEALEILEADVRGSRALGKRGADWLVKHVDDAVINVQTHCNAGALACVEWGTALGVVRALHERGALGRVYVDETRPLLQGARLTTWELVQLRIEHTLVVDSAGASVLARGLADAVVVGADRIAANGDVINKVGTYPLALAAARAGRPFLVAAPESTIDLASPTGDAVEIEIRGPEEIIHIGRNELAPAGTETLNLAFDLTPADLVTAIVTEDRVIHPASGERP